MSRERGRAREHAVFEAAMSLPRSAATSRSGYRCLAQGQKVRLRGGEPVSNVPRHGRLIHLEGQQSL